MSQLTLKMHRINCGSGCSGEAWRALFGWNENQFCETAPAQQNRLSMEVGGG